MAQKHDLGFQKRVKNELLNPIRLSKGERRVKRKLDRGFKLDEEEALIAMGRGWRYERDRDR